MLNNKWALLLLCAFLKCFIGLALDVSFIPNDENSPLPLSAKYRASLRKLCDLMKDPQKQLPSELLEKKRVLEKMCKKLDSDDNNIQSAVTEKKNILHLIGIIGGGYLIWHYRSFLLAAIHPLLSIFQPTPKGQKLGHEAANNNANNNLEDIRLARMKKLESMTKKVE
jgi:hypothetical protein